MEIGKIRNLVNTQFLVFRISTRVDITVYQHGKCFIFLRGRLHGAFSAPGLGSALLTGLKFFAITWMISTPGLKAAHVRESTKYRNPFCFLAINCEYYACSNDSWKFQPWVEMITWRNFQPWVEFNPGLKFQPCWLKQGWAEISAPGLNSALGWKFLHVIARFILIEFFNCKPSWNYHSVNGAEFSPGVEGAPCNRPLNIIFLGFSFCY